MTVADAPRIFRILLPAEDLDIARRFYESLLGTVGREVAGGRIYFDAGSVILGVLDYSSVPERDRPKPVEAIYLATSRLDEVHDRAGRLGCLSKGLIHEDPEQPMGEIRLRPWGERSFYVEDPSGNALCFVDDRTMFTGTPDQVAALQERLSSSR